LFATGTYGIPIADGVDKTTLVRGLFYGGGFSQLKAQFVGSFAAVVVVSAVSIALMYGIRSFKLLRLSYDGELEGLDIHEHGTPAYHMEFGQGMTYSTITGAGGPSGGARTPAPPPPPVGVET
jgi:Amt family ammonium transporter